MSLPVRILSLLPLLTLACSSSTEPAAPEATPEGIEEAKSELSRDTSPEVSSTERSALVAGNTDFALALFKLSAKADKNLVQSPHSISTALAMVYAGAAGQTKTDIASALHFGLADEPLHRGFNWLDLQVESRAKDAVGKDGKPARVHVDNLLFGAHDADFGAPFLDTLAVHYGAGVQRVDFAEPETVESINSWVAERTEQRIPSLLSALPAETKLVLVNTVYLNSAWSTPFEKSATQDDAFRAPAGVRQLPFMNRRGGMSYAETEAAQLVELELDAQGLVFDVILPKGELAAFEAAQTGASLSSLWEAARYEEVQLSLPKFKLKPAEDGSIAEQLAELGMGSAFSQSADFSPMITNQKVELFDVVHKTFFEIDEEGLEAAAATAVSGGTTSAPPEPIVVRVDKPFLLVLRDKPTGQVLFLGHITDPSAD